MFEDFIKFTRGLYKTNDFIPLHAPLFIGNEKKYLTECIDSTFVSSVGKFVDRFEAMVCVFTGAKAAVACVNGTNALHLALKLVGVTADDEVITQPVTFIATVNAIKYCNAYPVFIDVDLDTMGLSPSKMKEWLIENTIIQDGECYNKNSHRRIKACIPMHSFGHPVHLDELLNVCNEFSIELVEDAAESLGSYYKSKHTGTFGKIGVLSFNGNKTITTGGGGMLFTNDEKLANRAKHLSTQAKVPHPWEFVHDEVGYNYRMPNINAALGCAQLENLDLFIKQKRLLAQKYFEFFKEKGIVCFEEPENCESNYWLNLIILTDKKQRDGFLKYTNENKVMTRPLWQLMNRLQLFKDCQAGNLKNAEWLSDRVVNIPSSVIL